MAEQNTYASQLAFPTNLDPNSAEYQRWLMQNAAVGQQILGNAGGTRTVNPNTVLYGLQRPTGGTYGRPAQSGMPGPSMPNPAQAAATAPRPGTAGRNTGFDVGAFMANFAAQQQAANAAAAQQRQQAFLDFQNQQAQAAAARQAEFDRQMAERQQALEAQRQRQYEEQRLLNAEQIRSLNDQRATVEQSLRDAESMFLARRGDIQDQTTARLGQVLRNSAAQRGEGLASLAAQNRGLDPSASGRFLNSVNSSTANALADAQASGFGQIEQLKANLDAQQRAGQARINELNRLSTYLGTNVNNYFPGVSI